MPHIELNTNRHTFNVSDDKDGFKRKVVLDDFSFSTKHQMFIATLSIEYSIPRKIQVLDENGIPTGEHRLIQSEYETDENYVVLRRNSDTFLGGKAIKVSLVPGQEGTILNADRSNNFDQSQPFTSQYEFIYELFATGCIPLNLIEGLVNNWDAWANLSD